MSGLSINPNGQIVDENGEPVEWRVFDRVYDTIRQNFADDQSFMTAFVDYAYRFITYDANNVIESDVKMEISRLLNNSLQNWWDQKNKSKLHDDEVVHNENDIDSIIHMDAPDTNDETKEHTLISELVYMINIDALQDLGNICLFRYFFAKRGNQDILFNQAVHITGVSTDLNVVIPNLIQPSIIMDCLLDMRDTFLGAYHGYYWWAQTFQTVFLQFNLLYFRGQFTELNYIVTPNYIKVQNENAYVLFANTFNETIKDYNVYLDNDSQMLVVILNKSESKYWEKCLISESIKLQFVYQSNYSAEDYHNLTNNVYENLQVKVIDKNMLSAMQNNTYQIAEPRSDSSNMFMNIYEENITTCIMKSEVIDDNNPSNIVMSDAATYTIVKTEETYMSDEVTIETNHVVKLEVPDTVDKPNEYSVFDFPIKSEPNF